MEVNSSHNPSIPPPPPSGPLIRIDTVRSTIYRVTSGGHGSWRGRGKHLVAQYLPRYIWPSTSSRITRYIYQTATGDEGNCHSLGATRPFLLSRNIVIFIKFFPRVGSNSYSERLFTRDDKPGDKHRWSRCEQQGLLNPLQKMKFSLLIDRMEATVFFVIDIILKFVKKYFEIKARM